MRFVPGPDFPTGGTHLREERHRAVPAHRPRLVIMRGAHPRSRRRTGGEREQIIVTEIPYQVNKARLARQDRRVAKEKRIEGISEVRDESDREGMRIVIELKKDACPRSS